LILPEALCAGALAAVLTSLPAAVRVAGADVPFWQAWIAAAGLLAIPFSFAVAAARLARRSLLQLAPGSATKLSAAVLVWLVVWVAMGGLVGAFLKATTHHRPLAGATFALLALGLNGVATLVAWRLTARWPPRPKETPGRVFELAFGLLGMGLFAIGIVSASANPGAAQITDVTVAVLLDGALALAAVAVGAFVDVSARRARAVGLLGAGALALLLLVGTLSLVRSAPLLRALATRAPLVGGLSQSLGRLAGSGGAEEVRE